MTSRFHTLTLLAFAALAFAGSAVAQQPNVRKPVEEKPAEQKTDKPDEKKSSTDKKDEKKPANANTINSKEAAKNATAEQVAESAVFIYGGIGGRTTLNQIRKTAFERGKISVTTADGKTEQASYQRWTQRAETLNKEKIRLDFDFANGARYSLVFNESKIFGIVNDRSFVPQDEAARSFENHIYHGLEALLRYKENESTIFLNPKEKLLGVDYYVLDVTDKQSRKTRFFVSAKTFRVMFLEYEEEGVKYRRNFYDYNYAQGTLVAYQTVLWAGDKKVEESEVGTITFGQKVDDGLFIAATAG